MQGSAAPVSGRVSFLSGTKLDCGRLSEESSNEGTSLVDEPEHFRVPGHNIQANEYDSDRCLGHQTTEPSTITGNSTTPSNCLYPKIPCYSSLN